MTLVVLSVILAGGMMAFPWFDGGDGLTVPVVSPEAAIAKDATAYAERFGTTVDEAKRRLGLQSAIGSLGTALEEGEPDTFEGANCAPSSSHTCASQYSSTT